MSEESEPHQKNKRWLKITGISLATIIVVGGLGYGGYYLFTRNQEITPAANFTVDTLSGAIFTLSDYQNKMVLIDFMSVTCVPCENFIPELIIVSEDFNESLVIISIDIDTSELPSDLLDFKTRNNATWDFAFDTDNLQEKYSVSIVPKIVLIDKEGFITFTKQGEITGETLREKIQDTLEGSAERTTINYTFSLSLAFVAGVLSFFSPCAFPLLPGYMAYNLDLLIKDEQKKQDSKSEEEIEKETPKSRIRKRAWKSLLWGSAAALGIALFYMIIGLIAAFVGEVIGQWVEYITPVIGGLLIILGIISLTPLSLNMGFAVNWLEKISKNSKRKRLKRRAKRQKDSTYTLEEIDQLSDSDLTSEAPQYLQLFLYGITYALASIGCNGPIILGLTLKSIETGAFVTAILIFLVYSLAMALLMIVITMLVGFSKDALMNKLQASTKFVKILSGVLLILAGGFLIGYFLWNHYSVK